MELDARAAIEAHLPSKCYTTGFSLPTSWRLEDVQAGLNVVITVLSTLSIFTYVRACWVRAAGKFAHDRDVPLHALLSLNTLGEALDAFLLLGTKLFSMRYAKTLGQCIIVVSLSITAILAGLIARYSSRTSTIVTEQSVSGLLAYRLHDGILNANVQWNLTQDRLDKSKFPLDQLLDYLPSNDIDWVFDTEQWNSSWRMDCEYTPRTYLDGLETTGSCDSLAEEIPGLAPSYSPDDYHIIKSSWQGYREFNFHKDVMMSVVGFNKTDLNQQQDTWMRMNLTITTAYFHNVSVNQDSDPNSTCNFGIGAIMESSYTRTRCRVARNEDVEIHEDLAYPDMLEQGASSLSRAIIQYYSARMVQESTSGRPITVVEPAELVRFYQVYLINKDVQSQQPVSRPLNVNVDVVQISTVFIVVAALVALLVLLGFAYYAVFAIFHMTTLRVVPQSKVDWMIQSIQCVSGASDGSDASGRPCVTVDAPQTPSAIEHGTNDRVINFEAATYGQPTQPPSSWSNRHSAAATQYSTSPAMSQGLSPQFNQGKTPLLVQRATSTESYPHLL